MAQPKDQLTIDELAQQTGMTVRNIRAHQSRGLLPAPEVQGRIGYYGDRHMARLELIQQLQAGGFNLTAIQRLVERAEETGDNIGDLRNLVLTPFAEEPSEVMTLAEIAEHIGEIDSRMIKQAIDLGFVIPLGSDRYEVLSPTLLRAGIRALELGVPVDTLFDVFKKVNDHTRAIAEVFTKLVDTGVVRPQEKAGLPPESFPRVIEAIEGLRPLASDTVMASFRVNMDTAAEEAFGKILRRIAKEDVKLNGNKRAEQEPAEPKAKRSAGRRSRTR
ncbi:MAG: MerR family transcriptional regulator [Thermoleophilaceae bacterium]|nr:MerR family transcriptional regulator [Thermoleophilaceae bacterium]